MAQDPQIGQLKHYPNGDVGRWDGVGWEIISSNNPQLKSAIDSKKEGAQHPHARFAEQMAEWGLPTLGAVAGGKLGGPIGSGAGAAAGRLVGDAIQTLPEVPRMAREFVADPQATVRQVGGEALESLGTAGALGAATAAGERFLGPLLQKVPTIPLRRIVGGMGLGWGVAGIPAIAKVGGLGVGYNTLAKGAQLAGKGLEWLGTPAKAIMQGGDDTVRAISGGSDEIPLSNIQKAIIKETGSTPGPDDTLVINGVKQQWKDLAKDKAPRQAPDFPSPSIQQLVQRMALNAKGRNPEIAPLQSQIDDAVMKFVRENPGRVTVRNRVKGSLK
jgi:hypothetical protein